MTRFIPVSEPLIEEDEIKTVAEVLNSGWIGLGPKTEEFEKKFEEYIGVQNALATNSCTSALRLALHAHDIGPGDEVLVTPITFAATVNVIEHLGAKPVFIDIDKDTMLLDLVKIKDKITNKTRAIIPVHLAGMVCDTELLSGSLPKNIIIIEDAAHALGAEINNKKIGNSNNLVCFSFYPTKNITTIEGGMITTNNDALAEKLCPLIHHGLSINAFERTKTSNIYKVTHAGYKYNLNDVSSTLGLKQLEKINQFLIKRNKIALIYQQELTNNELIFIPQLKDKNIKRVYNLYPILIDFNKLTIMREELMYSLQKANIGTGIHFEALHLQPYYKNKYGFTKGMLPNAEFVSERLLSLPLSAKMTEEEALYVADTLKKILHSNKK